MKNGHKFLTESVITRQNIILSIAAAVFLVSLVYAALTPDVSWTAGSALSILLLGLILWAFEPIPFGMTSMVIMVLLVMLQTVSIDVMLSGFSSPAVFLVVAGVMLVQGVSQTTLIPRISYGLVYRLGTSLRRLFIGIFVLIQFLAFFIPTNSVRATLLLPLATRVVDSIGAGETSNYNKLIMVGIAFATNLSAVGVLTGAVSNILAVELLNTYTEYSITYLQWFLYALPLWVILTIVIPFVLLWFYPPEEVDTESLHKEMETSYKEFGELSGAEWKCIAVLILTVVLWTLESVHGFHPVIPAMLAVVLITLPKIGFVKWKEVVNINFDLILLIGASLSLGYALTESGALDVLTDALLTDTLIQLFSNPWVAMVTVIIISQLYHMVVTNISTAVVTLVPIIITISVEVGLNPVMMTFVTSITLLFGFILAIQSMPNVIIYNEGRIRQKDLVKPGIVITVISALATILVAFTFWNFFGLWP
ncbi:SLC13 family permease [Salinicoccus bachuensis]|uniref:DASS family sodium-coupled anion symporter n=1 Tax=Salinicoccus bachuensis TaxID=3136731 RepID=A0ABZ3CHH9_9STAP